MTLSVRCLLTLRELSVGRCWSVGSSLGVGVCGIPMVSGLAGLSRQG